MLQLVSHNNGIKQTYSQHNPALLYVNDVKTYRQVLLGSCRTFPLNSFKQPPSSDARMGDTDSKQGWCMRNSAKFMTCSQIIWYRYPTHFKVNWGVGVFTNYSGLRTRHVKNEKKLRRKQCMPWDSQILWLIRTQSAHFNSFRWCYLTMVNGKIILRCSLEVADHTRYWI